MDKKKQPFTSKSIVTTAEEMGHFGHWWKDLHTSEEYWSPGIYRMLAATPFDGQAGFENLLSRVHPADRELLASLMSSEVHQIPIDCEIRILRNSGTLCWIGLKSQFIYSSSGDANFVFYVAIDITHRKQAIESLDEQERRLGSLADSFKFVLFTTNPDGDVLRIQNWRALGLPANGVFADGSWIDHVVPDDVERVQQHWQECLAERKPGCIRYRRISTLNGALLDMIFFFKPVFAENGNVREWTGVGIRMGEIASPAEVDVILKGAHIRAARALLDWSLEKLAVVSGVSVSTIRRLEAGSIAARPHTARLLRAALESSGIEISRSPSGATAVGIRSEVLGSPGKA